MRPGYVCKSTVFGLFCLLGFLYSCSFQANNHQDKQVFRYNEPGGISSLDPAYTRNLEHIWAVNQLFDGLIRLDSNLNVQASLAKSWEIDSTQTQYTFHLRTDVYFHENPCFKGQPRKLVAQDFVYSLNRLVAPETASPGRWVLDPVKQTDKGELAIQAPNDSTLVIQLNQVSPHFLSLLAMQYCVVLPKEAIDFYGDDFRANPVGTGPFQLFIWEEGVKLVLHKNPNYWERDENGDQLPHLDAVSISFIKDQSAALMGMERGDFDFMSGLDPASKHRVLNVSGELNPGFAPYFHLLKSPFLKCDYLGVRIGLDESLDLAVFRQALSIAIDREKLITYVLNGIGSPASTGFVPPSLWKSALGADPFLQFQPQKAQRIIDSLQLTGKTIEIYSTSGNLEICEYIQSQWKALGLNCKVEILPPSHHRQLTGNGELALFRKSWIADYPDPENFLSLFYGPNTIPNGPNYFHYQNKRYDSLYEQSFLVSGAEREVILKELQWIVNQEMPVIPLFHDQILQLLSKRVKNFASNPMNVLDLSRVKMEHSVDFSKQTPPQ
ncbi:MAG: ABC transporter substrate-binding protein [Luteibaculum sp.]